MGHSLGAQLAVRCASLLHVEDGRVEGVGPVFGAKRQKKMFLSVCFFFGGVWWCVF